MRLPQGQVLQGGFLLGKKTFLNFLTSYAVRFGHKIKFLKIACMNVLCRALFLVKVTLSN